MIIDYKTIVKPTKYKGKHYTQPNRLLSAGTSNAKTAKNSIKTFILYIAPATKNYLNRNLCPWAGNCAKVCLDEAGRGKFSNVQLARINKANYFVEDKETFVQQLAGEIIKETEKAYRKGEKIAFRLNGTSDIDFVYYLQKYAGLDIATLAPTAIFYDYTKGIKRALRYKDHSNYIVTFSRAENNHVETLTAIKAGLNVSAVFNTPKDQPLPANYMGAKVLDGDASDIVMLYNKGVILGLRAKGPARNDQSGFVIDLDPDFNFL